MVNITKKYVIYFLINQENGKRYIGVTSNFEKRMREHKSISTKNYYISNAIRKYGWDAFETGIICETDDRDEAYTKLEPEYIDFYKSNIKEFGYNLTDGGDGVHGYIMTEEHREKLRYNKTQEHREKISKSLTGRKNPEHSERMKGRTAWNKGIGKPKIRVRKARMPETAQHLNSMKFVCEHCDQSMNKGNYSRWHGENCKVNS